MPQPITVTRTGTGWTLDVTALALSSDLLYKDFFVLHNGVSTPLSAYAKTSAVLLTYSGAALPTNTSVTVYRDSNTNLTQYVFGAINSSDENNARLLDISRALEDLRILAPQLITTHEAWQSVLPGGWAGTWRVRRRADLEVEMDVSASATFTLSAFVPSATILTLPVAYRPLTPLLLPTVFRVTGVDYAAGFVSVGTDGVITLLSRSAFAGALCAVRGVYTWSNT